MATARERTAKYRIIHEVAFSKERYRGVESIDFVTCFICGKRGLYVDSRHLMTRHNLTKEQYLQQFPKAILNSRKKLEAQGRPRNKNALGSKRSIESVIKLSLAKFGEKNPAWSGGASKDIYCCLWFDSEYKEHIKSLDNCVCQFPSCKSKSDLCIHHIDYNKKNCEPENLITLCRSCNSKVNKNRLQWTKFFRQLKKYYN